MGGVSRPAARRAAAPGRRLPLDTHTVLWWLTGDPHLSPAARRVIAHRSALAFVSAASAWEIATKVRLGRLDDPQGATDSLGAHLRAQGFASSQSPWSTAVGPASCPVHTKTRSTAC